MIRPFEIAAVATLALLMSTVPTFAQLEGTWQCEMTYTELTPQGQRTSGYIKQYIMGVYAGGGLEVQGSYTGIGGLTQFRFRASGKSIRVTSWRRPRACNNPSGEPCRRCSLCWGCRARMAVP